MPSSAITAPFQTGSAGDFLPDKRTLEALRVAAEDCRGCDLYARATQAVFGEGSTSAGVMLVGEQPGDVEDREGQPFVGPAGKLLDRALEEAGIARENTYVTNVVKHFSWEERGKRRIHKKPNARQVAACWPWLDNEIALVRPRVIVALGATAAQALFGRDFALMKRRGQLFESPLAQNSMATVHPSSILRAPDDETRRIAMHEFVADLRNVTPLLGAVRSNL
jgi:DNA polymerase